MIALLNFLNYDLDYVVEYPISIEQVEMTAETEMERKYPNEWLKCQRLFRPQFRKVKIRFVVEIP